MEKLLMDNPMECLPMEDSRMEAEIEKILMNLEPRDGDTIRDTLRCPT